MTQIKIFSSSGILKKYNKQVVGLFGRIFVPKSSSYFLKSVLINLVAKVSSLSIALDIPNIVFYTEINSVEPTEKDIVFSKSDETYIEYTNDVLYLGAKNKNWKLIESFILSNTEIKIGEKIKFDKDFNHFTNNNSCLEKIPSSSLELDNICNYPNWYQQEIRKYEPKEFSIAMDKEFNNEKLLSAINIISRLALEHSEIKKSVVNERAEVTIRLENNKLKKKGMTREGNTLIFNGDDSHLLELTKRFIKNFDIVDSPFILKNFSNWIKDSLNVVNDIGVIAESIRKNNGKKANLYIEAGPFDIKMEKYKSIGKHYNLDISSRKESREVLSWEFNPKWEVEKVEKLVKDTLKTSKDLNLNRLEIFVSEDENVRTQLKSRIYKILKESNLNNVEVIVYRAYKQAFCWIEEQVLPKLKDKNIDKIDIYFKPFLSLENGQWTDEDGATPTIGIKTNSNENTYLELPTRFLQELYPIDDIISNSLKIKRDSVSFHKLETNSSKDYVIKAYSKDTLQYNDCFNVSLSERAYLSKYPSMGVVHPNTGCIRFLSEEKLIIEKKFRIDLEELWSFYQDVILSDVSKYINESTNNIKQPLFKKLEVQVSASEPERTLFCRQDMISTLNAFHEDIYFVGLDYFRQWGSKNYDISFDEPGLILPNLEVTSGKAPSLVASLEVEMFSKPTLIKENNIEIKQVKDIAKLELVRVDISDSGYYIDYELECSMEAESRLKVIQDIVDSGINIFPKWLKENGKITIKTKDFKYQFILDKEAVINSKYSLAEYEYKEKIINCDLNNKLIEAANISKKINVIQLATSYLGRDILALEINGYYKFNINSFYKRRSSFNSLILNNRHHANEVSATNASYILLSDILNNKIEADNINLVIIPIENVDGTEIHYNLMQNNPNWKLHVARYNSVGKEIANDYFNKETKYGESKALPRLYSLYLPEVFIDNHGVPSHEWDQQFSGYVSPWFKGFWLPRALYYGYFWYPEGEKYLTHFEYTNELAESIAIDINKDKGITEINKDWKSRFYTYANKWLPKQFPANYYKDLIYYWIPYDVNDKQRHFSPRFPNITYIDMTTEVSDETVHGEYLRLCSNALDISNRSIIEYAKSKKFR